MSAHKVYDAADRKTALRLYKNGWGCLRISQVIGCYPSTVKRWVDEAIATGVDIERHPAPNYSNNFRKKVIAEYLEREDLSLDNVAKKNKISPHTLHRWLADAGIATRSTKPPKYDRKAIIADLEAGMKKAEIAAKHGCSESWVYRVQAGG